MEHRERLCQLFAHPNLYAFAHIPVQSASNAVLNDMRREYTIEQFAALVDGLRAACQRHQHCDGHHLRLPDRDRGGL